MIDIKKFREDPEQFIESMRRRNVDFDFKKFVAIDGSRNRLLQTTEQLRAQLKLEGKPSAEQLAELQKIKQQLEKSQIELDTLNNEYFRKLAQIPNLLAPNTPDGGEESNRVDREWGDNTGLDFEARDHLQLNEINDLFNFEAGAKVAGSRFYFLKDKMVRLWQAIELYAQDIVRTEGFELMSVPHMVNYKVADGTGYMPHGEENQNYIDKEQELVMIATAEIPLTGYHMDDVIDVAKPLMYAGLSPSYRLEAGTYGKFSKGLYRTHQFEKLEMYIFCVPSESDTLLRRIVEIEESICQGLNIPYQVVRIAAGDMSAPAYEKYDVEYYSPVDKSYKELTSASNCTDFQARNLNIRYRNAEGKLEFVHTLNGTAAVSSRLPIAILENYQQKDGTVKIPEVLQKYYGSDTL